MEPFSILKALDLSLPALGKSVSVVVKGLLVVGLIVAIVWGIYVVMVKPHTNPNPTTTVESGGTNYNYEIHVGFGGCARLPKR